MDEITASSEVRPVELVTGPTITLYRRDIETSTVTDEETEQERTIYTYRELRFASGEYDLVRAGMLPPGIDKWTEDLRRIQRSAILDEADKLINEANDNISCSSVQKTVDAWEDYRTAMRTYKMEVRETVNQETFPGSVTYPELPVQP